jgi:hypothetical protein
MKAVRLLVQLLLLICQSHVVDAKLADRSRVVQKRLDNGEISRYSDNGKPIEGPSYRANHGEDIEKPPARRTKAKQQQSATATSPAEDSNTLFERKLSNQLSGCCYNYQSYGASDLCSLYGNDCESGSTKSHDSSDGDCSQDGLSFIGISFSVNTASGNPYSYQLCDQFPMEHIIDRDYKYVMSMDEDGWLVGGGYKTFDYSGKMP